MSWTSAADPDGDAVTYDVYFGTDGQPTRVAQNLSETTYEQARDAIEARPAVQRGVKVLADHRKPQMSDKDKQTLFGSTQYARR